MILVCENIGRSTGAHWKTRAWGHDLGDGREERGVMTHAFDDVIRLLSSLRRYGDLLGNEDVASLDVIDHCLPSTCDSAVPICWTLPGA